MSEEAGGEQKRATELSQDAAAPASTRSSHFSLIVMAICVVAATAALVLHFQYKGDSGRAVNGSAHPAAQPVAGTLVDGKEYLIYLRSVEVQPAKANGDAWDVGSSAPDVFYRVMWKQNQIYESETMDDSLIAEWVPLGLSLKDSILRGQVSVDQAIKIPKVKVDSTLQESDEVIFKIIDTDLFSGNDVIYELSVHLSKLNEGDNIFDFRDQPNHSLIKAVVRVIDNGLSVDEKIQALMRGQ